MAIDCPSNKCGVLSYFLPEQPISGYQNVYVELTKRGNRLSKPIFCPTTFHLQKVYVFLKPCWQFFLIFETLLPNVVKQVLRRHKRY